MATFDDDELDEEIDNGNGNGNDDLENGEAGNGNNRNFFLALGILGGLFLVITIALVLLWLNNRQPSDTDISDINATNVAIMTANAQTAIAATQLAALRLTPSITPSATITPVPPTATATPLLAQATATDTTEQQTAERLTATALGTPDTTEQQIAERLTATALGTPDTGAAGIFTPTGATNTLSVPGALTEAVRQTQTSQASINLTRTATSLPTSGFADEVGLPGLFGMALGLILVIVLVRRLRLSGQH